MNAQKKAAAEAAAEAAAAAEKTVVILTEAEAAAEAKQQQQQALLTVITTMTEAVKQQFLNALHVEAAAEYEAVKKAAAAEKRNAMLALLTEDVRKAVIEAEAAAEAAIKAAAAKSTTSTAKISLNINHKSAQLLALCKNTDYDIDELLKHVDDRNNSLYENRIAALIKRMLAFNKQHNLDVTYNKASRTVRYNAVS